MRVRTAGYPAQNFDSTRICRKGLNFRARGPRLISPVGSAAAARTIAAIPVPEAGRVNRLSPRGSARSRCAQLQRRSRTRRHRGRSRRMSRCGFDDQEQFPVLRMPLQRVAAHGGFDIVSAAVDCKEVQRLEKQAVVLRLRTPPRRAKPENLQRNLLIRIRHLRRHPRSPRIVDGSAFTQILARESQNPHLSQSVHRT